jgi:outer membrane lipoprotein carrier protein
MVDATGPGGAGRTDMSPRKTLRLLALFSLVCGGAVAAAQGPATSTALDAYLVNVKTLRAEFTQVVTDGQRQVVQKARGVLVIKRPGRFRWELTPDGGAAPQLMVADGRNLWFYDQDLEQVSVKSAAAALTATPASLLSGDGKLTEFFEVRADGRSDGYDWVRVVPKRADADFREARLAFKGKDAELRRMVLKDKLGQTVQLEFVSSVRNAPVADADVTFKPPPGADVIGTPLP